jgi:hypothetical protein
MPIVVPMNQLFTEVDKIMECRLRPLHYAVLAELALTDLHLSREQVTWFRVKEDVREKMFETNWQKRGYLYLGQEGGCVAIKQAWLPPLENRRQLSFIQPTISIPSNESSAARAHLETIKRGRYMTRRNPFASNAVVFEARKTGLTIERHVRDWFAENYPDFFEPPDNEGIWHRPCPYDFALRVGDYVRRVDVFGPSSGRYERPRDKTNWGEPHRRPHLHIGARIEGDFVSMDLLLKTEDFFRDTSNWVSWVAQSLSIKLLVFWLNCLKHKDDYYKIVRIARELYGTRRSYVTNKSTHSAADRSR